MPGLIGEQALAELARLARGPGLRYRTGPFNLCLRCDNAPAIALLQRMYSHQPLLDPATDTCDFHLGLRRPRNLRRWWRPQIELISDAQSPFEPFPRDHAFALMEWGSNWQIAMQAHQFLMLHSAVVEKDGYALIMPAMPGSGKSTLCAALMLRGWRLLSDEFGLIRPLDRALRLHPMPRPTPLKNRAIEVIRRFSPDAVMGPVFPKTRKGDVAHLAASVDSQLRAQEPALPGWFLFPRYQPGSALQLERLGRGWIFLKLTGNSFNYKLQGARGFRAASELVRRCLGYSLEYSDLDRAIARIESLHAEIVRQRPGQATPVSG